MRDLLETHQEFHANFAEVELACRSMFNAKELDKCHQKLGRQQTSSLKSQVHPKGQTIQATMLSSRGSVAIWELWVLKKMHMKPLQLRHMNKVFCVCHVEKSKHVHPGFDPQHETQDMKYTWLQISFTSDVFSLRIFVCQRRIQTSWQVSREFSKNFFGLLWILEAKHQKKLRTFTMLSWKDEAPSSDNLQDPSET